MERGLRLLFRYRICDCGDGGNIRITEGNSPHISEWKSEKEKIFVGGAVGSFLMILFFHFVSAESSKIPGFLISSQYPVSVRLR